MSNTAKNPYAVRETLARFRREVGHLQDRIATNLFGQSEADLIAAAEAEAKSQALPSTHTTAEARRKVEEELARVAMQEAADAARESHRRSLTERAGKLVHQQAELSERLESSPQLVAEAKRGLVQFLRADVMDLVAAQSRQNALTFLAQEPVLVEGLRAALKQIEGELSEIESKLAALK